MASETSVQAELVSRHRTAMKVIIGVALAIILLFAVAFFSEAELDTSPDPSLTFALWISMVILAIGTVVLRRARLSAMRLKAVAGLRGVSGLIATLQRTTIYIALICLTIAVFGFLITLLTGDLNYTEGLWYAGVVRGSIISLILLVGYFPRRAAWQRIVAELQPQQATPS